ncbi:MAG: hypothetical protein AB8F95_05835 [Bacteroidia bacterium]
MRLIPFKDINEKDEFWAGARFIKKGTGLRRIREEEDYFEYMLINDQSSNDWMACANISALKGGSLVSKIKTTTAQSNRHTVTAQAFRKSMILIHL